METAKLQIHIIHVEKSFDERFIVSISIIYIEPQTIARILNR